MSDSKQFSKEVEQTVVDAQALFTHIQSMLLIYVPANKPTQTGIILALIDLLAVWAQAVRADRSDIMYALNMSWDQLLSKRQPEHEQEIPKHVN